MRFHSATTTTSFDDMLHELLSLLETREEEMTPEMAADLRKQILEGELDLDDLLRKLDLRFANTPCQAVLPDDDDSSYLPQQKITPSKRAKSWASLVTNGDGGNASPWSSVSECETEVIDVENEEEDDDNEEDVGFEDFMKLVCTLCNADPLCLLDSPSFCEDQYVNIIMRFAWKGMHSNLEIEAIELLGILDEIEEEEIRRIEVARP